MPERTAGPDWPRVLTPARGALPPAIVPTHPERVLHVALRSEAERQPGLERALDALGGAYGCVDWQNVERAHGPRSIEGAIVREANRVHQPTLVFMQIQRAGVISPSFVARLRDVCAPDVVIVNWDGDQHHEPWDDERSWFVELGREVDLSLVANTDHPADYANLGVRFPGFLACGYDEQIYRPVEPTNESPRPIVFLGANYQHLPAYTERREIMSALAELYGAERFAIYGGGWTHPCARPWVRQELESPIYAAATVAISMSTRHDLARCTSDRLFRALGSGTAVLVREFEDMEGMGLRPGVNCLVWSNFIQLTELINLAFKADQERLTVLRGAAAEMARSLHSWPARLRELMAMVYAVREARRVT